MTLIDINKFPPRGWIYREPSINWSVPSELALQGISFVVNAVQLARLQNPDAGLNPDYNACLEAVKCFTCERLKSDPTALKKFCSDGTSNPSVGKTARCASCGKR